MRTIARVAMLGVAATAAVAVGAQRVPDPVDGGAAAVPSSHEEAVRMARAQFAAFDRNRDGFV